MIFHLFLGFSSPRRRRQLELFFFFFFGPPKQSGRLLSKRRRCNDVLGIRELTTTQSKAMFSGEKTQKRGFPFFFFVLFFFLQTLNIFFLSSLLVVVLKCIIGGGRKTRAFVAPQRRNASKSSSHEERCAVFRKLSRGQFTTLPRKPGVGGDEHQHEQNKNCALGKRKREDGILTVRSEAPFPMRCTLRSNAPLIAKGGGLTRGRRRSGSICPRRYIRSLC